MRSRAPLSLLALALAASLTLPACAPAKPDKPASKAGAPAAQEAGAGQAAGEDAQAASPVPGAVPKTFDMRGQYVTATSMVLPRYKALLQGIKAAGGNAIVFDGKDEDGIVSWTSEVPLAKQIGAFKEGPLRGNLKAKIDEAHKLGVHVAVRVCCFHDPILAKAHPEWAPKDARGGVWKELGHQAWVDPSRPEVQAYVIDLAKELAKTGVDEIQFDYIRFPAMGGTQHARYAFDPKIPKHEVITGFLQKAYGEVHPLGKLVSIDVYGIMAWAQDIDVRITGQKLEDLARHTDVICPMVYPSHFSDGFAGVAHPANMPYQFVYKGVDLLQKRVKGTDVTVRPWLQAMPYKVAHFTPDYVTQQLKASHDTKAIGWMLWNAQNQYDVAWAGARAYTKAHP